MVSLGSKRVTTLSDKRMTSLGCKRVTTLSDKSMTSVGSKSNGFVRLENGIFGK